jgi:hypothetical protein
MSAKVDECRAAGAPESLRRSKSRSSLLDVELSRATFVQKSEGFEVFRRKLVGDELLGEFVRREVRVAALVVSIDESLLFEGFAPFSDPSVLVARVSSDVSRSQFKAVFREKSKDSLVGGFHPFDSRVHIQLRHSPFAKSLPFSYQVTDKRSASSGLCELHIKKAGTWNIDLSETRTSGTLSSVVLLQKRGDTPGHKPESTEPGALPYRTMSDARQPRKFSGSVVETPEIPENGFAVSVDLDNLDQNQVISVETDELTVAMWVDGDARRQDVVDVLEDLAAEAEYLAGDVDA